MARRRTGGQTRARFALHEPDSMSIGSLKIVAFPPENARFPRRSLPGGARTAESVPEWPSLALETPETTKMQPALPRHLSRMVPRESRNQHYPNDKRIFPINNTTPRGYMKVGGVVVGEMTHN